MTVRKLFSIFAVLVCFVILVVVLSSIGVPSSYEDEAPGGSPGEPVSVEYVITPAVSFTPPPVVQETPEPVSTEAAGTIPDPDEGEEEEEPADPEPVIPLFEPYAVPETDPELLIASSDVMAGGLIQDSYVLPEEIDFTYGFEYSQIEGITAFRGNNFRDSASYGRADIQNAAFGDTWKQATGSLTAPDGEYWSGHGWTGQPLIVKWPKQTREIMNMYDWAREREELVEVVYAAMDGYIYFNDLDTGSPTRDRLYLGFTFKGSGSLDPRGYPLLYVGAGYDSARGVSRIFVISLIDGSVLLTFGNGDGFAHRDWPAADGSPLVDADTDSLIYPSENGVIYIIKLGSEFDPEAGTMTIDPSEPVKWRYFGKRSHTGGKYWLGYEDSAVIWRGHLIIADNGGHLICLNLNTFELVWVTDILDDTNCSPVLELEDGHPYIYISTSFHGGWRASAGSSAVVPVWKIDAVTGETVWHTDFECYTRTSVSGGVQGTAAVGQNDLSDLVFFSVAMTPSINSGTLAALDKQTGEVVWKFESKSYGWSSPVCVYDRSGYGYIIHCTADGSMYLIDGLSGEVRDSMQLGGLIEASPAVYESTVVIGTRVMLIWGVRLV